MTLPNAYQWADDKQHYICAWCPDKDEAEKLVGYIESRKELESVMLYSKNYYHRKISHTICKSCADEEMRNLQTT